MIYFIELNKRQSEHSSINIAMLNVLNLVFIKEKIIVYSTITHSKSLKTNNKNSTQIEYKTIKVIDGDFKSWFSKFFYDIYNIYTILKSAKKNNVNLVFISSVFSLSHLTVKFIGYLFRNMKIIIGIHGELEYIKKNMPFKLKFLGFFIKLALRWNNRNIKYLIFGQSIYRNLKKNLIINDENFIVIDHPYLYDYINNINNKNKCLTFGSIGIASEIKNSHLIFKLAAYHKDNILNSKVKFQIIGKILFNITKYNTTLVKLNKENVMINQEDFNSSIIRLDYAICFYDNNFYYLSASGSFFDAIKYEKPIIALQNDFFKYYFSLFGDIGYLCNEVEEMSSVISDLIDNFDYNKYSQQVENLKIAKRKLSIDNIKIQFEKQLNSVF